MKVITNAPPKMRELAKKWGWFFGLWLAGVACVLTLATIIRWMIL